MRTTENINGVPAKINIFDPCKNEINIEKLKVRIGLHYNVIGNDTLAVSDEYVEKHTIMYNRELETLKTMAGILNNIDCISKATFNHIVDIYYSPRRTLGKKYRMIVEIICNSL